MPQLLILAVIVDFFLVMGGSTADGRQVELESLEMIILGLRGADRL